MDVFFENVAQALGASLNVYTRYLMKRRTSDLKKLQERWDLPRGTLLTLKKGLTLEEDIGDPMKFAERVRYFDVGYSPMFLEVRWPTIEEEPRKEKPIVFVFWCSGSILRYCVRLDSYDGTLPFEVSSVLGD